MKQLKDYLLLRPGDTNENVFKEKCISFRAYINKVH